MRRSKKLLIALACHQFAKYLEGVLLEKQHPDDYVGDRQREIKVLYKLHRKFLRKS